MTTRSDLHREFANRFHAGKKSRTSTDRQLAVVETTLGVLLPVAYRQFLSAHGALYCPAILDLIVERKCKIADVQQFLTPRGMITETKGWGLDTPRGAAAFAGDCSGNLFTFRKLPESGPRPDDAPVWLFDHETGKAVKQASSFDVWLSQFLRLRPLRENINTDLQNSESDPRRIAEAGTDHRFQVVVQFPETFFASPDEIRAFGEKLSQSMPRTHEYDGFDAGSGIVNYFIYSNTPTAVLANFRKYLGTNKVEKKVRIAYREADGDVFVNIWPKRDSRPFDYFYE